jgi:hypothetical protein
MSGKQDEIVPHEHMQMLWEITTERCNPDGTKKVKSAETAAPNSGGWFFSFGTGSTTSSSTAVDKPELQKAEEEDGPDDVDPDLKEYSNFEIVDDQEVLVSKRTRYRTWKEFEDGKHSKHLV